MKLAFQFADSLSCPESTRCIATQRPAPGVRIAALPSPSIPASLRYWRRLLGRAY